MLRVASADPRPNRAKGRSRLAEMIVPQRWWSNADTSSQQEIIGRGHQRNRRRDLGTAVQANGRPLVCAARRATAAGRSPGRGVAPKPIKDSCRLRAPSVNQELVAVA